MVPEQMQPAADGRVLRSVFRPETENMTHKTPAAKPVAVVVERLMGQPPSAQST
jgi:hypothetical protein